MSTTVVNLVYSRFDVYIGRPGVWGNPFIIGKDGTREEVVAKFREYILAVPELIEQARKELKGKTLGCFCKPHICHGDVWVELIENDLTKTDIR